MRSGPLRVALQVTCINDVVYPGTGRATVALLRRLGVQVDFPSEQTCCGQPMINTGYLDEAVGAVRHQHAMVAARSGVTGLLTAVGETAARVFELSEFILDVLGVTHVGACFPHRVTYHPTCHSLRAPGRTPHRHRHRHRHGDVSDRLGHVTRPPRPPSPSAPGGGVRREEPARMTETPAAPGPTATPADLVALFAERVADYRAGVHRAPPDALPVVLGGLLPAGTRVVVPEGFPVEVLPATVTVVLDPSDEPLSPQVLDNLDAVLTTSALGIAVTGTVVLDHGPGQGRRAITLVPDTHICLVRRDSIVSDVPQALARLVPTRPLTWISGPSATSDIELSRVEGVHGRARCTW